MGLAELKEIYKEKDEKLTAKERHIKLLQSQKVVSDTIIESTSLIIKYLEGKITKTQVLNQIEGFATSKDIEKMGSVLEGLNETLLTLKPNKKLVVDAISALKKEISLIPSKIKIEKTEEVKVSNLDDIKHDNSDIVQAIKDKNLEVNVEAPIINTEKIDLKSIEDILSNLLGEIKKQDVKVPDNLKISNLKEIKPTDTKKIETKLEKSNKYLKEISEKNFSGGSGGGRVSPYQDTAGIPAFVELINGKIPVDVDMVTEGIATSDNQSPLDKYVLYATEYGATYNYICKEDKDGAWYIQRETISTGIRDYAVGTSAVGTAWTGRAGQTYGLFSGAF